MTQKEIDFIAMRLTHNKDKKTGERTIVLKKLSDDNFDLDGWILDAPADYTPGSDLERADKVEMSHFEDSMRSLQEEAAKASRMTRVADKQARMLRMSLQAFGSLNEAIHQKHDNWSKAKKRWKTAMSKTMMENLCEKFRRKVEKMTKEGKFEGIGVDTK